MKMEKEKQLVEKYKRALSYAARDFARTKTDCIKCECRDSCGCDPSTVGCRLTLYLKWKHEAGIKDNHGADDAPTYAQEQLEHLSEKEKQMVTKVTNCGKCRCKGSCECNPGTVGCALALRRLADIERREEKAVNHPAYYKHGGVEAIDAIEAWELGFNLGNVVKYIARAGHKTADSLQDLQKAAWYLEREIERVKTNEVRT